MFYVLERIEDQFAVLISDDRQTFNVELSRLPQGAKIGDVFVFDGENYILDDEETQKRKDRIVSKHLFLFKK